jgi:hypothetical protein
MLDRQHQTFVSVMWQCPGISASVQQSSSDEPIGHKFFFSANRLSKYGILMLVESR